MRTDYRIRSEPRGAVLRDLLLLGARQSDQFLVTKTGMQLSTRAELLLAQLEPHLVDRRDVTEFPGGRLPWGTIEVRTYQLVPATLDLLLAATPSLYDWQEPDLPGDLTLLSSGEPWLITMASDRVALLALEPNEFAEVAQAIPALRLRPVQA